MSDDSVIAVNYDRSYEDNLRDIHHYLKDMLYVSDMSDSDLSVIAQAFITPGYGNEHVLHKDYNRLEFLGDAVIRLHVTKHIFEHYPSMNEGEMSKLCQFIWNDKCYPYDLLRAGVLFTGIILLPRSEEKQDRGHRTDYIASVVSDCFEALIGALETTGHHQASENFMDKVLFMDLESTVSVLGNQQITIWESSLNALASTRITSFKDKIRTFV